MADHQSGRHQSRIKIRVGVRLLEAVEAGGVVDEDLAARGGVGHPHRKTRLRPLAVTSLKRTPVFPEVPTLSEAALPGYDMPAWRSIAGPAGVRREIVVALNGAIARSLDMPDVREKMLNAGSEPAASSPDELAKRFADWIERFGKIAAEAGIKPQ